MAEIPENLKEIIDEAVNDVFGNLKFPEPPKKEDEKDEKDVKEKKDEISLAVKQFLEGDGKPLEPNKKEPKEHNEDGLSEAVKSWLNENEKQQFKGKEL